MAHPLIDLTGQRFTRWVVLGLIESGSGRPTVWLCQCDCGTQGPVTSHNLRYEVSKSCGCLRLELSRTHGDAPIGGHTREYRIWCAMRKRCTNSNSSDYRYYGGRGITVCERWNDYALFLADMGRCPPGLTIERRENNKGYQPDNCYWASRAQQSHNQRLRWGGLCKRGHTLDIKRTTGRRFCRTCSNARDRIRRSRLHA